MTSTPKNQPHSPKLHIDLDEILTTTALELARVQICNQCQPSLPSLIDDLAQLVTEITRLHSALVRERLEDYAKLSLKKYKPMAALKDVRNVRSGRR
jgi:hypothetical protein